MSLCLKCGKHKTKIFTALILIGNNAIKIAVYCSLDSKQWPVSSKRASVSPARNKDPVIRMGILVSRAWLIASRKFDASRQVIFAAFDLINMSFKTFVSKPRFALSLTNTKRSLDRSLVKHSKDPNVGECECLTRERSSERFYDRHQGVAAECPLLGIGETLAGHCRCHRLKTIQMTSCDQRAKSSEGRFCHIQEGRK